MKKLEYFFNLLKCQCGTDGDADTPTIEFELKANTKVGEPLEQKYGCCSLWGTAVPHSPQE